jgi:hypothetical protein
LCEAPPHTRVPAAADTSAASAAGSGRALAAAPVSGNTGWAVDGRDSHSYTSQINVNRFLLSGPIKIAYVELKIERV